MAMDIVVAYIIIHNAACQFFVYVLTPNTASPSSTPLPTQRKFTTQPNHHRTSGRSTKLIHGGIRYLETAFWKLDIGSYKLVQEALEERAHMLAAAPYMNSPLPIMIPIYKWWELPYFWAGAKAYDLVAATRQKSVPASHYMDACVRF